MQKTASGIRLKPLEQSDAETLARCMSHPEIAKSLPALAHPAFSQPETWRGLSKSKGAEHYHLIMLEDGTPIVLLAWSTTLMRRRDPRIQVLLFSKTHIEIRAWAIGRASTVGLCI